MVDTPLVTEIAPTAVLQPPVEKLRGSSRLHHLNIAVIAGVAAAGAIIGHTIGFAPRGCRG